MQCFGCVLCSISILKIVGSIHEESPVDVPHVSQARNSTSTLPMLQLLSLDLDKWGKVHHQSSPVQHELPQLAHYETIEHPLLSLMSLSLDKWGSKDANCNASDSFDELAAQEGSVSFNPLARVFPSEANLFDPRGFEARSLSLVLHGGDNQLLNFGMIAFVLFFVALIVFCLCCESSQFEDDDLPCSPTQEVQQDFATVEYSDGSWAQVYREAQGEQKECLELLFRCNIISTDEFTFSSVSQEHIQECMWIGTHMLRQKPLEEWVALWQQAQQTFEDSVTACFEARGGPYSSTSGSYPSPHTLPAPSSNLSLGTVPLSGRRLPPSIGEVDDEDDPYATRPNLSPRGSQDPVYDTLTPQMTVGDTGGPPDTQISRVTPRAPPPSEQSNWSIENELNTGLAAHGLGK